VVSKSPSNAAGDLKTANVTINVNGSSVLPTSSYSKTYIPNSTAPISITYSVPFTFSLGSNEYSHTWDITWSISGNYQVDNSCSDPGSEVTVSTLSNDFSTGGGYITNAQSKGTAGIKQGESPAKNNFGFDVKWNKSMTNLQGHFNTIIRSGGRSYQVKSAKPNSTTVYKTATGFRATITYINANLQDLTSLVNGTCHPSALSALPNCSDGGGTVILSLEDNGEPGSTGTASNDRIAITIKDKNGVLFYASNNSTTIPTLPTAFKYLLGGNIQIRSTTTAQDPNGAAIGSSTITSTVRSTNSLSATLDRVDNFNFKATPNPSNSYFTLQLSNGNASKLNLRVTDVLGRVVESRQSLAPGQTLRIGSEYRPGVYIVQVMQGDTVKQLKLVKQ
jgi:hypothetical protein